jgi:hypothetical protein
MTALESYCLSEADAAKHIRVKTNTLTQWRRRGQGPVFARVVGRVRYSLADLEAWMQSRRVDPAAEQAKPCRGGRRSTGRGSR